MPGSIVHLIVQQQLPLLLKEGKVANLLRGDVCSPYTSFGSIGPDFLFFSLTEYGTPLDELLAFVFQAYDAMDPIISFYRDNIEPIIDAIEDAIIAVDKDVFQGLFKQAFDTSNLLSSTVLAAAGKFLTTNIDFFEAFHPKIQKGESEDKWFWFDFLHYRRTGQFCSQMWKLAQGDDDLLRYCIGYASHIAVDVVGHPYVNAIVGGPFRMHWQRHKLVENWIDAYARNFYKDTAKTKKCLRLGNKDIYLPNSISGSYYSRLCEFPDKKLPQKLQDLLLKSMDLTYANIPHPITFNAKDLDSTYRLWLKWFERATKIGSVRKPLPVPPPGAIASGLIADYGRGFPAYPGRNGPPTGGGFSVSGIFASIAAFAQWLIDCLTYSASWVNNNAEKIIQLPTNEALGFSKWLLYQIQKCLWEIYDNLRFGLVLGGYLFPEPEDLNKYPWNLALLNTASVQLSGGPPVSYMKSPFKRDNHNLFGPVTHHLVYPNTLSEKPHAESAPIPFHGVFPDVFISGNFTFDPYIEKLYDCKDAYGASDKFTHYIDQRTWQTGQLGSAMDFAARLISEQMDHLPNFNLDGDRGYGWKTWVAKDPKTIDMSNPVDVKYIDEDYML